MNAPLPPDANVAAAVSAVIAAGRLAASRQWTPATSGNFSARVDADRVAITRSGVDKGGLAAGDILVQPLDQPLRPGSSAEAGLHVRLYRDAPEIGAIFHVHAPASSVISRLQRAGGAVCLHGWELQKALRDVTTHEATIEVPVFVNDQDIPALAERVATRFAAPPSSDAVRAPGYLLAGHGLYAWGRDPAEAWRHLEALETLFHQILSERSLRP